MHFKNCRLDFLSKCANSISFFRTSFKFNVEIEAWLLHVNMNGRRPGIITVDNVLY